jgi:hypothetical protein
MSGEAQHPGRVIQIGPPERFYDYLVAESGQYAGSSDGVSVSLRDIADDEVIWQTEGEDNVRHVASGTVLALNREADGSVRLSPEVSPERFRIVRGPERLPSEYLAAFRAEGWVCLTSILTDDIVAGLQQVACVGPWSEQIYDTSRPPICQSSAVGRASAEPVSLWLIRQYMGTPDIRLAHSPSMAILGRDDDERDVQGWHSDFPYLWGITSRVGGDRVPRGSGDLVLGVQRNFCVTGFRRENGATIFKLGTHTLDSGPPEDWGTGAAYQRPGHRKEHGLPYGGDDTDVVEAPAGSIIVYDARTWHRAGQNRTDEKRAAMLQAVTPMFIMPFTDTSGAWHAFTASEASGELTDLERKELESLLVHKIVGPAGTQPITIETPAIATAADY